MEKDYLHPAAPRLGFGLMRLPKKDKEIDIEQTSAMVDTFLEAGFNYFDTAYVYEGSEEAARKALTSRHPRESYFIASKLPGTRPGLLNTKEDNKRTFFESLERLGIEYFDSYLLHNNAGERIELYDRLDSWEFCLRMKQEGYIHRLGFSCHDTPEKLDEQLTRHPEMDFVQLQINFIDWENHFLRAHEMYEVARKHNTPIVIMEPIKGGMLANLNENFRGRLKEISPDDTAAALALRFCASLEGVPLILSGMSTLEQVKENVRTMKNVKPLTMDERFALLEVADDLHRKTGLGCTACRYCTEGCPMQIPIPEYIRVYNDCQAYEDLSAVKRHYGITVLTKPKASECVACGQCESVCPQRLPIIKALRDVAVTMGETPSV